MTVSFRDTVSVKSDKERRNMNSINNNSYNEADYIRTIQRYLRELSHYDGDIPLVPVDGVYDNITRDAVTAFQRKYDLPPTGIVNRDTWVKLFDVYNETMRLNNPPKTLNLFPREPLNYEIAPGDEYFLVSIIQFILQEISSELDYTEDVMITGVFDESTERAVSRFQRTNMLEETGRVDKETWNRLADFFNRLQDEYYQ